MELASDKRPFLILSRHSWDLIRTSCVVNCKTRVNTADQISCTLSPTTKTQYICASEQMPVKGMVNSKKFVKLSNLK